MLMSVEEFDRLQEERWAKEKQEREAAERAFLQRKCEELGCSRLAKCTYCGKLVPSKPTLPFFEERKDRPTDAYYCGCSGWE